ncbi:MAG: M4 family metallopeptidase [Bacteroidales bacterium]|nr:M4 family metallopeptidase [Bacteroidales bacterium]
MKKLFTFSVALLLLQFVSFSQTSTSAQKSVAGAERIVYDNNLNVPTYMKFKQGSEINVSDFANWMQKNFSTDSRISYKPVSIEKDNIGMVHYRYQQTFNGHNIENAIYILHTKNNKIQSVNGKIFDAIDNVSATAVLSEKNALDKALNYFAAKQYKWQVASEELMLKKNTNNPDATYYPKGELVYVAANGELNARNLKLAYKFNIYSVVPLKREYVYVDASSGEIIWTASRIFISDVTATASTKYSGTQTITTDSINATSYRLRETGRGNGVETYDLNNGTDYMAAVDFTDTDKLWNRTDIDQGATDGHWGAEKTYDYYLLKYGRNSIDGNGYKLRSYVHYDVNYSNAFWDDEKMTYGDGSNSKPWTALDICAHEVTHGLTSNTANLIYQYESGALNEGFSDIFATCVEFMAKPATANWTMATDIMTGFRNISNPNATQNPDTYLGTYWQAGGSDIGGVHTNSTVLGYWFYLLSQGGSGTNDNSNVYSVPKIGRDTAAQICYRTLTVYLTPTSNFFEARSNSLIATADLFGECSAVFQAVVKAWYAVGIGPNYAPGVVSDFTAVSTSNCFVPFEAKFTNNSTNSLSYKWTFGDGTSSSEINPSHVYTAGGTYTVKLVSQGGTCGKDSVTKTNYISISTPVADPTVTPADDCDSGTVSLLASGTGILNWYNSLSSSAILDTGHTFITPLIYNTTTYYVQAETSMPVQKVGPVDNTIGAGGIFTAANNYHFLKFNAMKPLKLLSVKVYSQGASDRQIEVLDNYGRTIAAKHINIPDGTSRVTLDFDIPVGNDFKLICFTDGPNLYRNTAGSAYPYTITGLISITGQSSTTPSYYYFFYDWEVQETSCKSERVPVTATINYSPESDFGYAVNDLSVQFNDSSLYATGYNWDFGDGNTSSVASPVNAYATYGTYIVTLITTNPCGSDTLKDTIDVLFVGIKDKAFENVNVYPNPANDLLNVTNMNNCRNAFIEVYGYDAKLVGAYTLNEPNSTISIRSLKQGYYYYKIISDNKIVKQDKLVIIR